MAYIGAEPLPGQNREVDDISSSFNGSTTAFTLQVSGVNVSPESANNILVNLGGVIQNPGTDYTIAASTITFTTAPASGLSFFALILGAGINTATVADQTIGTSKVLDNAITADKLAHTSVTAGSYTTADITVDAQGRITAAASGSISNAEIANNAVTTAKIADSTGASDGVTTAKLATDAVTAAKLADNAVVNASVDASAAIAGTKISPNFGSQNIVTTGTLASADVTIDGSAGGTLTIGGSAAHTSKLVIADNSGSSNGNLLVEGGDGGDFFTINSAGNVKFEDNKKALFGAGADLELYHDGSTSYIKDTGTGNLRLATSKGEFRNAADNENLAAFTENDAVELYYDNSKKFETTSTGIEVNGHSNNFNAGANALNTNFISAFGGAGATSVIRVKMNTSAVNGLQIQQAGSGTAVAGGNHAATVFNTENAKLRLGANNVEHFRIENNGDLKATDTSIGSLSDSRLKKNIVDFTYDLTKFKNLRPRIFDWINPELHLNQSQVRGFVAQEIETVDSTLVGDYTLYDETLTDKNPDLEIIKADDGTNIAKDSKLGTNDAMYISVIQQMLTKIETLETKVAALEAA